jgi:hypothetical protein
MIPSDRASVRTPRNHERKAKKEGGCMLFFVDFRVTPKELSLDELWDIW